MAIKDLNTTPPPPEPDPLPLENAPAESIFSGLTGYSVVGLVTAGAVAGYALASRGIIETPEVLSSIPVLDGLVSEQYDFEADGPFAYTFTAGERTQYQLDTRVTGKGFDLGEESAISLLMGMSFGIETLSVDQRGFGELELEFDRVQMTGNFMGEEVQLYQTGDDVEMYLNRLEDVSTAEGDSIEGISRLEFFSKPVKMIVSPDGMVREVSGPPGFDQIIAPHDALAPSQFPSSNLEIGQQWESDFTMPVPGLAVPAQAKAYNTLVRYETLGTREVGAIRQEIRANQDGGSIESPSSVLGDGLNFNMPTFDIEGENWIYFDINDGKLVRTDMNLFFSMELGQGGEGLTNMLNQLSQALSELDNPTRRRPSDAAEDGTLLEMGVEIASTLALIE